MAGEKGSYQLDIYSNDGLTSLPLQQSYFGVAGKLEELQVTNDSLVYLGTGAVLYVYAGEKIFKGFATVPNSTVPNYPVGKTFTYLSDKENVYFYIVEEEKHKNTKTFDLTKLNLSVGTHNITVKARANGYEDSLASNEVSYTYIIAPYVTYYPESRNLQMVDDYANGDIVVSYNIYISPEETYVSNVLKTGRETDIYLPNLLDGEPTLVVRAVDANGNLSGKSNLRAVCFVAGTPVLMADNSYKMIEEVQVGDEVKSYNFQTKAYCKGTVTKAATGYTTRIAMVLLEDGSYVAMSEGHPLYTRDGWHSITNKDGYPTLVIGDEVLCQSKYVAIRDIQVVDTEPTMVYSLGVTVSNGQDLFDGTYFAGISMTLATHGGGSN